jgi:MFS family permease
VTAGLVPPCKWIADRLGVRRGRVPALRACLFGGGLVFLGVMSAAERGGVGGGLLMAGTPALLIGAMSGIVRRRERRGSIVASIALLAALGTGTVVQLAGLQDLVVTRRARANHAAAIRVAVPEGSVILTDRPEIPHLLATLSPARPVLYLRPGTDLVTLDRLVEGASASSFVLIDPGTESSSRWAEAILPRSWREIEPVASIGGLALFRRDSRRGVRGFSQPPEGD